jgi:hypothetical protein
VTAAGEATPDQSAVKEFVAVTELDRAVRGSGGATFVPMMEPTHLRDRHDPPGFRCLDIAGVWRVLLQAQVRATPMIIVREVSEMAI